MNGSLVGRCCRSWSLPIPFPARSLAPFVFDECSVSDCTTLVSSPSLPGFLPFTLNEVVPPSSSPPQRESCSSIVWEGLGAHVQSIEY